MNTLFSAFPVKSINGYLYRLVKYNSFKEEVYAPEHILIAEHILDRCLKKNEYVVHVNGIWSDNTKSNLKVINVNKDPVENIEQLKVSKRFYNVDENICDIYRRSDASKEESLKEIKEYLKTHTVTQTANKFGVSGTLISKLIKKFDLRDKLKEVKCVVVQKEDTVKHLPSKHDLEIDFENDLTNDQVCVKYSLTKKELAALKSKYMISKELRAIGIQNVKKMKENIVKVIDDVNSLGVNKAAYKYNISIASMYRFLKDYGGIYRTLMSKQQH